MPFADLRTPDESALNKLLAAQLPASVEQSLRDAGTQIQQAMARVVEALPSLDPTLAGRREDNARPDGARPARAAHESDPRRQEARRDAAAAVRTRAQSQAFPDGHPQERTLGLPYFLNKYGPGLVDLLLEELPVELGQHWLITL